MGYFVGLAKFREKHAGLTLAKGLFVAVLLHGAYDFFLMQQYAQALAGGAVVALATGMRLSLKAIHLHRLNSPFNPALAKLAKDIIPSGTIQDASQNIS
jgi:RsiW-degrading membrane proteinase PrsW (M82 family)